MGGAATLQQVLAAAGGSAAYRTSAVNMDAVTRLLNSTNWYASDQGTGIASFWLRFHNNASGWTKLVAGDNTSQENSHFALYEYRSAAGGRQGNIRTGFWNGAGTYSLGIYNDWWNKISNAWYHTLIAWNTNLARGSKFGEMYINDVRDGHQGFENSGAYLIDYTQNAAYVMQSSDVDIADLYVAPGQFLDITVEANRRKFISADGYPVYLGAQGELPTGVQPRLFLSNNAAQFNLNRGSMGNFAVTGTIANAASSPSDPYRANAVYFDGTDYIEMGISPWSANASGIVSFWVRQHAVVNTLKSVIANLNNRINWSAHVAGDGTQNWFEIFLSNSNGGRSFTMGTSHAYQSNAWYNVLASWDCNYGAGEKVGHLYINDVSDCIKTDADASFTVDYSSDYWNIGKDTLNADVAEFWFAPGRFLDFSVTANRRKFITAAGKPAMLGPNGERPLGEPPGLYLASPAATFHINRAWYLNDFGVHGALTASASSPSD